MKDFFKKLGFTLGQDRTATRSDRVTNKERGKR